MGPGVGFDGPGGGFLIGVLKTFRGNVLVRGCALFLSLAGFEPGCAVMCTRRVHTSQSNRPAQPRNVMRPAWQNVPARDRGAISVQHNIFVLVPVFWVDTLLLIQQ